MKRFRFEMNGMFTFHTGENLGHELLDFMNLRPNYVKLLTAIVEVDY